MLRHCQQVAVSVSPESISRFSNLREAPLAVYPILHGPRFLRIARSHRIRVTLRYERIQKPLIEGIASIKLENDDGTITALETRGSSLANGSCEAVALLDPASVKVAGLWKESPTVGAMQGKYLKLTLVVAVQMLQGNPVQELKHTVYCRVVHPARQLHLEKFSWKYQNGWEQAPDWMRQAAKASVFVAKLGRHALQD